MQAIQTKYIGPSNVRGSRVKATAQAGSVTIEWDDALNSETNHRVAAEALARKFNWDGEYVSGGLPDGSTVWVNSTYFQHGSATFQVERKAA